jgi:predicted transcriptional regulator
MNKEQWQLTIYVPKGLRQERPLERLRKLARQRRRSLNFLVLEAILHYLRAQESKQNAIIQN